MSGSFPRSTFAPAHQPEYDHTQRAPLYLLVLAPGLVVLLMAVLSEHRDLAGVLLLLGVFFLGTAFSFRSLRVVDEGDALAIRYGPLPVFRTRIRYAEIQAANRDRSTILDGWGVRWTHGRGWLYNLWGFDCVRLTLAGGRKFRIGTDDPDGLVRFLSRKLEGI